MKRKLITILTVAIMVFTAFAVSPETSHASSYKYWLKVNKTANVVNVYRYKDGKWEPYKVMLCSTGKSGGTPSGTYSVKKKWRWQPLFGGVYGQYVTQFKGNFLFHSELYTKKRAYSKCNRKEYNKLGQQASHGCVRLATMDAKWIYTYCNKGTKVTVYSSSTPGPLGKPKKVTMLGSGTYGYDPTDPISSNTKFNMTGPVITIDKEAEIAYGSDFDIKAGVTAQSPYTFQNLTGLVKVYSVSYQADGEADFVKVADGTVDTTQPGVYKIKYSCYHKYCGKKTVYKTFTLTVLPEVVEEDEPEAVDPDADADADSSAGVDSDVDSGSDAGVDSDAAVDPDSDAAVDSGSATEPDAGTPVD